MYMYMCMHAMYLGEVPEQPQAGTTSQTISLPFQGQNLVWLKTLKWPDHCNTRSAELLPSHSPEKPPSTDLSGVWTLFCISQKCTQCSEQLIA